MFSVGISGSPVKIKNLKRLISILPWINFIASGLSCKQKLPATHKEAGSRVSVKNR
jgi:hypothetical protein